jgi:hypothetical protein
MEYSLSKTTLHTFEYVNKMNSTRVPDNRVILDDRPNVYYKLKARIRMSISHGSVYRKPNRNRGILNKCTAVAVKMRSLRNDAR